MGKSAVNAIQVDVVANVASLQLDFEKATKTITKFHGDYKRSTAQLTADTKSMAQNFQLEKVMKVDGVLRALREALPDIEKFFDAWRAGGATAEEAIAGISDKVVGMIPVMRESYKITGELLRNFIGGETYDPEKKIREAREYADAVKKLNSDNAKLQAEADRKAAIKKTYTDLVASNKTPLDSALDKIGKLKEGMEKGFITLPQVLQAQADILAGVFRDAEDKAKQAQADANAPIENKWRRFDWEKKQADIPVAKDESVSILNRLLGTQKTTEQIMREQLEVTRQQGGANIRVLMVGG